MRLNAIITSLISGVLAIVFLANSAGANQDEQDEARRLARHLIELSTVKGGIIVHLGCGEGELTAALRISDSYTVHGLEADPARVIRAREHIRSLGLYGPVSVEQFSSTVLPYTDNLINLVIVSGKSRVPLEEVKRVLVPAGVACIQHDEKLIKGKKSTLISVVASK